MVVKTRRKKGSKHKRFPYIEVEGMENRFLDAALLQGCGYEVLRQSLPNELKLLKKVGITTQELRREEHSNKELVKLVSPHLLESYDFYNLTANICDEIIQKTVVDYFDEAYINFTKEEWNKHIKYLISEKEMPIYTAINTLRFYKNGEIKELIKPLLEVEEHILKFYEETGIKIEGQGFEINWDKIVVDDIEDKSIKLEENSLQQVEDLIDQSPNEALKLAAKIILDVSDRVSELEELEKYKKLYESEKETVESLKFKIDELTLDVKSKDSQTQALSKENRALSKSVESLAGQLENQQKESGRLGGLLGEIRKEKDDLDKANNTLISRVSKLENESSLIAEKVQKELKKEFDNKALKTRFDQDERIKLLDKQMKGLQHLLEEEQLKNSSLLVELENVCKELNITKKDLEVVEKERNELAEKIKTSKTLTGKERDSLENGDDLLFDFDEVDIFVEFDNKPTRN